MDTTQRASTIVDAFRRKLKRGQARGGIVVVNADPTTVRSLTRSDVRRIKKMWAQHNRALTGAARADRVVELWLRTPNGYRYIAGAGLGLVTSFQPTR